MRDINSLTKSKTKKAWAVKYSMAWKPSSMQEVTLQVVQILDAKYEKADIQCTKGYSQNMRIFWEH